MDRSRLPLTALLGSLAIIAFCAFSSNVAAQMSSITKGSWIWEGRPDSSGSRTYVGFYFDRRGNRVRGTYSVSTMDGPGEDDSARAGSIPFAGTIKGDTIILEYDPEDVHTHFTADVRYRKPRGKAPSTAILKLVNGKLELKQTSGSLGYTNLNVPRQFTMELRK